MRKIELPNHINGELFLGNNLEVMPSIQPRSIDLIFADPPFNIGLKYDKYDDNLSHRDYMVFTNNWINQCLRLLKPNGSFYIAIGDDYAGDIRVLMRTKNIYLRNWIIWYYSFGQAAQKKFTNSHTHILYFVRNLKDFTFNADDIKVPTDRLLYYHDQRTKGYKLPDDVWNFNRICANFKDRAPGNHPCQMPPELMNRIISASSNENDVVLDPFAGSGSTLVAANKYNRRFIGIEISQEYCNIIKARLSGNKSLDDSGYQIDVEKAWGRL